MTVPSRLWCRCHHHTAWPTSRGWVLRYKCVNGQWGGGGGHGKGANFAVAVRWCAECNRCQKKREETSESEWV